MSHVWGCPYRHWPARPPCDGCRVRRLVLTTYVLGLGSLAVAARELLR